MGGHNVAKGGQTVPPPLHKCSRTHLTNFNRKINCPSTFCFSKNYNDFSLVGRTAARGASVVQKWYPTDFRPGPLIDAR